MDRASFKKPSKDAKDGKSERAHQPLPLYHYQGLALKAAVHREPSFGFSSVTVKLYRSDSRTPKPLSMATSCMDDHEAEVTVMVGNKANVPAGSANNNLIIAPNKQL